MALRAKKPEAIQKRLKLLMYGSAGVGKTTAAVQFPAPYIIDSEKGTENYDKLINESGGVVFHSSNYVDICQELRALLTEKHDYRTLVIDPITTIYADLLDSSEKKVGSSHGRHYGEANKLMKRMTGMMTQLDMNVIVTAHAKAEYGENLTKVGMTFDGWKQLDYVFDLVIELQRPSKKQDKRIGKVVKTRLEGFKDQEEFAWTYDHFRSRLGAESLERESAALSLATKEQVKAIQDLLAVVKVPDDTVEKWFSKAGVECFEDMPAEIIEKCIDHLRKSLPRTA